MNGARALWFAAWRVAMRYHRYTVDGLQHLDGDRASLVVGYHGRPIAYGMCMFSVAACDHLGYVPHGIMHAAFDDNRVLTWLKDGIGFVTGDGPDLAAAVARGEHVVTLPGGTREGCRSVLERHKVDWGRRTGYLRLAFRHGLSIIPVGSAGDDDTYLGLNNGYRLGKRLAMPNRLPLWFGLGPLGLWPFSPPFPSRIRQVVGPPIPLPADIDPTDRDALLPLHRKVVAAVQSLVDEARTR